MPTYEIITTWTGPGIRQEYIREIPHEDRCPCCSSVGGGHMDYCDPEAKRHAESEFNYCPPPKEFIP